MGGSDSELWLGFLISNVEALVSTGLDLTSN